jgi:hypothetical protein
LTGWPRCCTSPAVLRRAPPGICWVRQSSIAASWLRACAPRSALHGPFAGRVGRNPAPVPCQDPVVGVLLGVTVRPAQDLRRALVTLSRSTPATAGGVLAYCRGALAAAPRGLLWGDPWVGS